MVLEGQIVDVVAGDIFPGSIELRDGRISEVRKLPQAPDRLLMPGFGDAHVHIESSMLLPYQFARLAVVHGTIFTISDPHEIANVVGIEGVKFMLDDAKRSKFRFYFGAPSCVPATTFETAGATLGVEEVKSLLTMPEIYGLAEMMNFPGVLHGDPEVIAKLEAAKQIGKVIDGHAPGLRGADAKRYAAAGPSTDHECFTAEEALDKLEAGMQILIREGSAAKNFEALIDLLPRFPDRIMFCSDDKHPNDLAVSHIDALIRRALARGIDRLQVIRAATLNPVRHYKLDVGLLQPGDRADFVVIDSWEQFGVLETYIGGELVAQNGQSLIPDLPGRSINKFNCASIDLDSLRLSARSNHVRAIRALEGQLITKEDIVQVKVEDGMAVSDPARDVLKLVVVNRYRPARPAVAFVTNFGLKRGALASSVAHDSHNIVAVGCSDAELVACINLVIRHQGGVAATNGTDQRILPLPVGGLMSPGDGFQVARDYDALDIFSKQLGSTLPSPFMTLSFLALLVIPELKLSDLGLFDGRSFKFTPEFI